MLTIKINKKNEKEKLYIIDVFFNTFLGLKYKIKYHNNNDYYIYLNNVKKIIIQDHFFNKFNSEKEFLHINNLPKNISLFNFEKFENIPILYGNENVSITENIIELGADIFASSFFMLTRWEEYVNQKRDIHNRFLAKESIAYKNGFLNRPIVNEYVEILWCLLIKINPNLKRNKKKFNFINTHDVDLPRLWWSKKDFIKSIVGALIKRKSISEFFNLLKFRIKNSDPFDTFDHLMKVSENNGIKSHFFFMSGGTSNKDNFYKINHPKIIKLIKEIKDRGHHIGFHPSYNAYNDSKQFNKELVLLKEITNTQIETGREHFLRFEVPTTWQVWEDHNMIWDSSMSYHDIPGFRCGVCYDFPVFNILSQKQLKLIERPLIVMEGCFITYQNIDPSQMEKEIKHLIEQVKKYNGNFVFLWHNSAFNIGKSRSFQYLYKKIVAQYSKND